MEEIYDYFARLSNTLPGRAAKPISDILVPMQTVSKRGKRFLQKGIDIRGRR